MKGRMADCGGGGAMAANGTCSADTKCMSTRRSAARSRIGVTAVAAAPSHEPSAASSASSRTRLQPVDRVVAVSIAPSVSWLSLAATLASSAFHDRLDWPRSRRCHTHPAAFVHSRRRRHVATGVRMRSKRRDAGTDSAASRQMRDDSGAMDARSAKPSASAAAAIAAARLTPQRPCD